MFDNHNHSEFSFDGKRTSVEKSTLAAADAGLGGVAFTDHCDFFVPAMKAEHEQLVPETFDVNAQQAEIDRVQALIDGRIEGERKFRILKGIEIGMHEDCHGEILRTLGENSFDQVIASVHYLDGIDPFYGGYYEGKDWKEAYGHYLETIWKEMTWLKDFDIMGHFDYVVRYAPYSRTSLLYRDFSDILDEMFRYLIQEGKALEINTKSYQEYNGRLVTIDTEVLKRYRELGGEIVSFGSDSHDAHRIGHAIMEHALLLKSLGFRWSAHYESRRLVQLPL
ncbi:MAG: histidinol-phosphatase HisJ family protein [Bacteroidales bacterium]|nr:histidinol-phosphatase HisJ family protein [Bacteroidales bacterium]